MLMLNSGNELQSSTVKTLPKNLLKALALSLLDSTTRCSQLFNRKSRLQGRVYILPKTFRINFSKSLLKITSQLSSKRL